MTSFAPAQLRCEYAVNPLGIDEAQPRLSWIVESAKRGQRQTAYQIVVSGSEESLRAGRGDLWDTGKVASDETIQIVYAGKPLRTGQRAYWKVRVWDGDGQASGYSEPAWWEMGLLEAGDWKAQWIGLDASKGKGGKDAEAGELTLDGCQWVWSPEGDPAQKAAPGERLFRRRVDLPADRQIRHARFLITGDDQYTVYVNGQLALRGGNFKEAKRISIDRYLSPGANQLAVSVQNGGKEPNPAGVIGKLRIDFDKGEPMIVAIDKTWKAGKKAEWAWRDVDFDDAKWPAAKEFAKVGEGPWGMPKVFEGDLVLPESPYLRKGFTVDKPVRRARVYAAALGYYELHLNGQRVGNDLFRSGWTDFNKRVYYQTYDVTQMVRQGGNAVGVILGDGWCCGYIGWDGLRDRYGIPGPRGRVQLQVEFEDGTSQVVASDGSWKGATGPILEGDMLMGEAYDARREMPGWDANGFDDSGWQSPIAEGQAKAKVEAQRGVTVQKMVELTSQKITEPTKGRYVFDLGQNMVGWARLKVKGEAGTKVVLRFAEMLNPDGTIYTTNLRTARATDTYVLKGGGIEEWEPRFTFHGFRYVEVTGYPGKPGTDAITGVVVHSATPPSGTFECSSPMVNQLQHNIVWGQRGNFLEVPTDCPQRDERMGWMGDAQIFVRTACWNMDVAGFFTKWMVDVDDAQREDGSFTDVSPVVAAGSGTAAWGDAGAICPWTIYQVYGDKRILERHYAAMTKWVEYLRKNSKDLIRPAAGYGDWLSIKADTPKDVLATAYFARSTDLTAKAARALGKQADAQKYEKLFADIKAAFNKAFVGPDGRIKGNTQTCYVLALHFGLLPAEKQAAAAKYLAEDIRSRDWHLSTGFVGTGHLNSVLARFGHNDVAYRLLNTDTFPSWGYSIRHGATTIWERWDGWTAETGFQDPGMNSFNHYSFGAVGAWMYSTVAGIDSDPEQPGFKHIIIRPEPGGGLTYAKATYDSIRGRVASDWKVEGGKLRLNVTIPANTSATVYLPVKDQAGITEGGKPAGQAEGVKFVRADGGSSIFEVGSGQYVFEMSYTPAP